MSRNEIKIFNNAEFGEVRITMIGNAPMFCLADVCKILEIKNVSDCKSRLKADGVGSAEVTDSLGRKQIATFVNESNLYKVIFQSRKESAERFTDWVTSEVLPSIRKHGGYINNADLLVNTYFDDIPEEQKAIVKGLLQNIESKQKKITALDKENDLLAERALQWADRPLINALVRAYGRSLGGDYSTAWGDFKKELLYRHGINLNARITHFLNNTGKKTKPRTLDMLDDSELQKALSTAAALYRENNVDISDIIDKKAG